uniref:G-protein coupled receptors family 1 profile domain-containing protein n=1 Tax=Romanomermis culicivorax TaxID=13658 RepID=A0A915J4V6_ROMCU
MRAEKTSHPFLVYKAAVTILIIWMGSAFVACPLIIVLGVYVDEDGSLQCDEFWPDGSGAENVYSLFLSVVQFLIPFCVFILTYLIIGVRLWTTRVPGENNYELNKVRKESVKKVNSYYKVLVVKTKEVEFDQIDEQKSFCGRFAL